MAEIKKALQYNKATSDYLAVNTVADFRNMVAFTWEAWIKPGDATDQNARLWYVEQGGGSGNYGRVRFACSAYTGKLRFEFGRQDGNADTDYTYSLPVSANGGVGGWDDRWHHVAFACDLNDGTYDIIFDGYVVQSGGVVGAAWDNVAAPIPISNTAANAVWSGRYSSNGGTNSIWWDGKIQLVRYWKAKIDASTIRANQLDRIKMADNANCLAEWYYESGNTFTAEKNTGVSGTWSSQAYRSGVLTTALPQNDRPVFGSYESGGATVIIEDTTVPTAPAITEFVQLSPTSARVTYTGSTDNVYVQNYVVTLSTTNDFSAPVGTYASLNVGKSLTTTFLGLTPSTVYYVQVRAVDSSGNVSTAVSSGPISTAATGDNTSPSRPTNARTSNITTSSFRFAWNASTDNVGVTGYKIDIATDPEFANLHGTYQGFNVGSVLFYDVNVDILDNVVYYARVRSYDASFNESAPSTAATATTLKLLDAEPPLQVVPIPASSVESNRFTARWNATVDNYGVASYQIDVSTDASFATFVSGYNNKDVGDVLAASVTGLASNTIYYYRVRAKDVEGNTSVNSDTITVTTLPSSIFDSQEYQMSERAQFSRVMHTISSYAYTNKTDSMLMATNLTNYEKNLYSELMKTGDNEVMRNRWYRFMDQAEGTVAYDTLSQQNGVYVRSGTYTPAAVPGTYGSTQVYGRLPATNNSYIRIPPLPVITTQTSDHYVISFQAYITADPVTQQVLFQASPTQNPASSSNKLTVFLNTNKTVSLTVGATTVTTVNAFNLNFWNMVQVRIARSTGTSDIICNAGSVSGAGTVNALLTNRPFTTIGAAVDGTTPFIGYIGNFSMVNGTTSTYSNPIRDVYVNMYSAAATSATVVTTTTYSVLKFFRSQELGALSKLILRLYLYRPSVSNISVQAYSTSNTALIAENTDYAAMPAAEVTTLSTNTTAGQRYVEIDVTSLVTLSDTQFAFKISTTTNPGFVVIGGKNDIYGYAPELLETFQVQALAKPTDITAGSVVRTITNYMKNPSLENTLHHSATGGASLSTNTTDFYRGTQSRQITIASTGYVRFGSASGLTIPAGVRKLFATFRVKAASNVAAYALNDCKLFVTYGDATTSTHAITVNVTKYWKQITLPPISTTAAKTVVGMQLHLGHTAVVATPVLVDTIGIYDVTDFTQTAFAYFDGETTGAAWSGNAHDSTSVMNVAEITAIANYVGDSDNDATARAFFKRADQTDWTEVTGTTTINTGLKTVTTVFPPTYPLANQIPNPLPTYPTTPATFSAVGATLGSYDDTVYGSTLAVNVDMMLAENTVYLHPIGATSPYITKSGADVRVSFWIRPTQTVSFRVGVQSYHEDHASSVGYWSTRSTLTSGSWQYVEKLITTNSSPEALIKITFDDVTESQTLYLSNFSAVAGSVAQSYLNGLDADAYWEGIDNQSVISRFIRPSTEYDVMIRITDPDGTVGTNEISQRLTTTRIQENATTTLPMILTPNVEGIAVEVPYTGDDDNNNTIVLEFKRSDHTTWSIKPLTLNRPAKKATTSVTGLTPGATYEFKATYTDTLVFGTNPQLASSATIIAPLVENSYPIISFNGFELNGPTNPWVSVSSHNGFSFPTRKLNMIELPRMDGAVEQSVGWGSREINLDGQIYGEDRADLAGKLAAMRRAISTRGSKLYINTLDEKSSYYIGTVTSFDVVENATQVRWLNWSMSITCADPFRYANDLTVLGPVNMTAGVSMLVDNTGDVQCHATYLLNPWNNGVAARMTIQNLTTGDRLSPLATFNYQDKLYVDTENMIVLKNGVPVDFAGTFPKLVKGTNEIRLLMPNSGNVASAIITRRHKFF